MKGKDAQAEIMYMIGLVEILFMKLFYNWSQNKWDLIFEVMSNKNVDIASNENWD